ncbi:hypothetical protein J1N35_035752 [Gossypium stocksii]|uniref:Uncharacterized protein n=1 Tax=Gossypium stocksii TaxID=47602 RepID=A0A9D3UUJ5_9ROSI|nr:hypothetical protein J1N35_035752 [Gossypium stocksii]
MSCGVGKWRLLVGIGRLDEPPRHCYLDMRMQLQGIPHRSRKDRRGDTPIVKVCYIGSVAKAFQQMELDKQQVKKANSIYGFTNQSNEVKGSIMLLATLGKENQASAYIAIFRRPLLKASKWP